MQVWRFFKPDALGFTFRLVRQTLIDRLTGAAPLPLRVRDFVAAHARRGDPQDVLKTMDRFAREERFLMNIGPEKGPLVRELLEKLPSDARILELGAFCGYSSIMLADTLGSAGRIVSLEVSGASVEGARANVDFAGLSGRVEIIHGGSTETIPSLEGSFDLVFLDHWKDLYKTDLQAIEAKGLLRPGSIVVADNVGPLFGATEYIDYVRNCGRYDSEHREATVEYSSVPDAVEISVYRP
ncbi:MAG: methyltransferase domain-containing protein [bacterium]|nr:SAM-dependent methyltransferase [Deltaproteobacteria bacterium]MCP4906987.1 methyltransferase domain-containing protein [bacterium]